MNNFDIFYDSENNAYQVRTKSEAYVIEFPEDEEQRIFLSIVDCYKKNSFYTLSNLKQELRSFSSDKILDVVQELQDCGLLNPDNFESNEKFTKDSPFCMWDGLSILPANMQILFIGHRQLGELLSRKASILGFEKFSATYTPTNELTDEELEKHATAYDFIILDATHWNPRLLKTFNNILLRKNKPWLFVSGMIDNALYSIGPIFHGTETGCYECLDSRILSNDRNAAYTESYIRYLIENNSFSKNKEVPELVESIVSSIILMDVNKYVRGIGIPEMWKNCLHFNIYNYSIEKHYVLKNPLCEACHPNLPFTPSPWLEGITIK